MQASVTDESNATQTSDSMNLTNNATASSAAEPDQAPAGPEVNMQMPAPILAQGLYLLGSAFFLVLER